MSIYESRDYKEYVSKRLQQMPSHGRGELQKIASFLKMHSTRISHVFRGSDHLTLEQGHNLTKYFGLNAHETEYFIEMLQYEKAGTEDLKNFFETRLKSHQDNSLELSKRVPGARVLEEHERGVFYSNWYYSAIRILSSIDGNHTVDSVAARFRLPKKLVNSALEFLLNTGLCVQKGGRLKIGAISTHLESTSPLVSRLHANWRLKAIEHHSEMGEQGFAYSGPVSIRKSDAKKIRQLLVKAIESANNCVDESKLPDALYCLNVDWFEF